MATKVPGQPSGPVGNSQRATGINEGPSVGFDINVLPTGGGRVAAGWVTGGRPPWEKNPPPTKPSEVAAMRGWC